MRKKKIEKFYVSENVSILFLDDNNKFCS